MALGLGEWLAIGGFFVAASGLNLANTLKSWIQSRDKLNERFDKLRKACKDDCNKLERLARSKFGTHATAIKNLNQKVFEMTTVMNDLSDSLFQVKAFLQKQEGFIEKSSPDLLVPLNPFNSFELEITEIPLQEEETQNDD